MTIWKLLRKPPLYSYQMSRGHSITHLLVIFKPFYMFLASLYQSFQLICNADSRFKQRKIAIANLCIELIKKVLLNGTNQTTFNLYFAIQLF